MKRQIYLVATFILLTAACNLAFAQTKEEVVSLVQETKAAIEQNALQTLARVNRAEHPYKNKDNPSLYVFVFDTDLTVVAHAIKTGVIGKNVKGKGDVNGKLFRDEMLEIAQKDGSGWVDYMFMNPKTKETEPKTAYFELANGSDGKQYIVGSGKYAEK